MIGSFIRRISFKQKEEEEKSRPPNRCAIHMKKNLKRETHKFGDSLFSFKII